jgi:hypothetical protein
VGEAQLSSLKTAPSAGPLPSPDPDGWLTPTRFGLMLGALIFVSFPQVLLGIETFFIRDYGLFSFPNAFYQRECFWHGESPLWNPYSYCGVPFLAQWNTMPLYPVALVYLLFQLNGERALKAGRQLFANAGGDAQAG